MNPTLPPRRCRWLSWLIKGGITAVVLLSLLIVTASHSVGWIIGRTLQSQLSTRMQAKLEFGRVIYKFPYGVRIDQAHLLMPRSTRGPDSWIDIGRLELRLAKLPIGIGPLVIERLEIENPTVRLASSFGNSNDQSPPPPDATAPRQKLSDLFKLQSVSMTGGRFEYDLSANGHTLPPVIWDHLDATLGTRPTDISSYQFDLSLNDKPLATVKAKGSFDIDSLVLDLERVNVEAGCDSKQQAAQLPPVVQAVIQKFQIGGQLAFDASAHVPLRTPEQGNFTATLTLKNGQCQPPGWTQLIKPAESTVTCTNHGDVYDFKMSAADGSTAAVNMAGSFNAKNMEVDVPQLEVTARCDSPQLPPKAVEWVQKYQATGQLKLTGSARAPVQNPNAGQYNVTLTLDHAQLTPPGFAAPVTPTQFALKCSNLDGPDRFILDSHDADLVAVQAAGSVDRETQVMDLDQLDLTVNADPAKPIAQLPKKLADALAKYQPGGHFTINGAARVPLKSPLRSLYFASVNLKEGRCQPPGWNGPVSPAMFALTCSNAPDAATARVKNIPKEGLPDQPTPSHLWIDGLNVDCGKQNLSIANGGEITFNPNDKTWAIHKLHGVIDIGDGPGPLDGKNVRVWQPFIAAGEGKLGDDHSSVRIALDGGAARVTPGHILIDAINGLLTATPVGLTSSGVNATCAMGTVSAWINVGWKPPSQDPPLALTYAGEMHVSKLDLHQLARQYTQDPIIRQQAFGQLDLNNAFNGTILANSPQSGPDSPADRLVGHGDFDINHGYFLAIPVLKDVLSAMNNPGASVAGEAASTFDIAHQTINISQVAVSSPAIGVQGSGTLGFDQTVNMVFIATPLSSWKKDMQGSGIGVFNQLAEVAGKAQDLVNKAESVVLFQARVTGLVSNPKVDPVAVPVLSDRMGPLFNKMAGNHDAGSMSEELKKQQSDQK